MRKIVRYILCFLVMIALTEGETAAFDLSVPYELESLVPEAAELIGDNAENGFGILEGIISIVDRSMTEARRYMFSGVRAVAVIMLGVVLLGVIESCSVDAKIGRYTTVVGTLWITAVSAGDVSALIGLGQETISRVSVLSKLLIPTLATATAAAGGVTSASVRQVGTVFFSDILLTAIEKLLIPMLYLYIGTAVAASVLDGNIMERIGTFIKKMITWCLSGLLILFTTYLAFSGAIAGTVDGQALRMVKTTVSTFVPIVGGILSEAAESLLVGAGLLRGMLGVFGMLAVLSVCLVPFLRLGVQYLLYQAAGFVTQTVGSEKLTKLLSMIGDAFALMLAMTAACALVLIISLVSTVTVVIS